MFIIESKSILPGVSVRYGIDNRGMIPVYATILKKRETLETVRDVLSLIFRNYQKYKQIAVWVWGNCMAFFGFGVK